MWQLLASESGVLIHSGFVYMPLLFDPHIRAELEFLAGEGALPPPGVVETIAENLIYTEGGYFIRSLSLASLVDNYPAVFPEEYERQRCRLNRALLSDFLTYKPLLDARLKTILFDILPHFVRPRRGRRHEPAKAAAVLDYLASKVPVNHGVKARTDRLRARETALRQVLLRLEQVHTPAGPIPENRRPGPEVSAWFQGALHAKIVSQEISHWRRELEQVQDLLNLPPAQLAVLLAIAARGAWEIDGFGFRPDKKHQGEYLVYKRTGEYVLKDYFGRLYLFPDCRVGVSTSGPFHPVVFDMYKHPLLRRFGSRQAICLNNFQPSPDFSAPGVCQALEEGLNALFYGYNSRKRNGYNSLDKFSRHLSVIDFDDWGIPPDHPRVTGGELEVKNDVL